MARGGQPVKDIKQKGYGNMVNKDATILLVEDDEVDQLAMRRAFEKLKIKNTLIVAEDGIEGLQILRGKSDVKIERPYLIILDLNMPRMSGLEFLKELRADDNLKEAVVFVLTTSRDENDMLGSYNLNVAGYVVKSNLAGSFMEAVNMIEHYWRIVELPN